MVNFRPDARNAFSDCLYTYVYVWGGDVAVAAATNMTYNKYLLNDLHPPV